ncbi:hypothetical protein V7S43_016558 [Phytophthora oleae]|uniref:Uncharacterized protein n=1 Tax=Phytophthora oleae TaxID=2107226 RepID=A0ABD3EV80_9STRA
MARGNKSRLEDHTDGAAVAQSLQSKRTKTSTKRTYSSKLTTMTSWLKVHHPDTVDGLSNAMRIPLLKDAILAFFGHICSAAETCDRDNVTSSEAASAPLAASSVWGYRSALVDVYRSQLLELDPQVDTELRRVLEGYEKVINNLKNVE